MFPMPADSEQVPSTYLDNAATTFPKPERVYSAVERFMREVGGSAGRSAHARAVEAGRAVYSARESVAALLGGLDPLRLVFTKNATEAINIALLGLLCEGDHVVTTSVEHNSVMRPLEELKCRGVDYSVARCGSDGTLDPAALEKEIRDRTKMIVMTHASNVTGAILPLDAAAWIAGRHDLLLLLDAAQTAGRLPLDGGADMADAIAFSGHKELFGPQGTGCLYLRKGLDVKPLMCGGTGSASSSLKQPGALPEALESGTLNAAGIAGLGAGVSFVRETGIGDIRRHEEQLMGRLFDGLSRIKGVVVHGPDIGRRIGIVPLTFERNTPPEIAENLDSRYGIACRAGLHCSPMAHRTIGTIETGALRVSFSFMNTENDVDHLLMALGELVS